jgi:hypothetical protein
MQPTSVSKIQNLDIATLEKQFVDLSPSIKTAKLRAGELLYKIRQLTPHGEWEPRLKNLCERAEISRSTAHEYDQPDFLYHDE